MVRCSIIDTTSGQLLRNRKNGKNQSQETDDKDTIQAVMTKGCRFASSRYKLQSELRYSKTIAT